MRNIAAVSVIMIVTLMVQISVGMSAVIFPVKLDELGFNKVEIGTCLSIEIFAVLCVSGYINRILSKFGLFASFLLASLIRTSITYFLPDIETMWGWLISLFFLGMATNIFLIGLQTWLGTVPLGRFNGLIIGIFSAILSAGVAAGPAVLDYIGIAGAYPFYINAGICLAAFVPVFFSTYILPKLQATGRLRLIFVFKSAPVVLLSAFVGGITFFGLPAFSTLFGTQEGLELEQAAYLITAFMLGSIVLGLIISFLSDFWGRSQLTVVCVFVGLVCAVYLPLAIKSYQTALILLFVWGGVMSGIYGMGLATVNSIFRKEDLVSANVTYGLMDCSGGVVGVFLIGSSMQLWHAEGLSYVIVTAGVLYFIFVLSQRRVSDLSESID